MELFNTNNMQVIEFCCEQFNFVLPSRQIANRPDKFIKSDSQRTNLATDEMRTLPLIPPKSGSKSEYVVVANKIKVQSNKVCY